jgi:hypothetical protein
MIALRDQRATAIIGTLELDRRTFVCLVAAAGPQNEAFHTAQVEDSPSHPSGDHEHERQEACGCPLHFDPCYRSTHLKS